MSQARGKYWLYVGLPLLGAIVWLWVRSYAHGHVVAVLASEGRVSGLTSSGGNLSLVFTNVPLGPRRAWTIEAHAVSTDEVADLTGMLSSRQSYGRAVGRFSWGRGTFAELPGSWFFTVGFPHAVVVVPLCVPVFLAARRRWVVWRRRRAGLCLACGYDLRHSPGRCPECGWEREAAGTTEVGEPV